jgi:hypothetical protein
LLIHHIADASFESGFGFREGVASMFESQRVYVHCATKRTVNIRDGDQSEREQEREREYLDGVEFEIVGAE